MADDDFQRVFKILEENESKNFVQRIFRPDASPSIINADGSATTHRMSTASSDGKHYVFPMAQMREDGILREFEKKDWRKALQRALDTNDAIAFDTQKEAEWFERHWKLMWNKDHKADY